MSHEAVTWAMDHAPMLRTEKGKPDTTARHVLQVLAEHAHKDGTGARPSVLRIQYRSGYDERTVQRALRRLEDGELIEADGIAANGCVSYKLHLLTRRPESDWAELEEQKERERAAAAERKRKSRANAVTSPEYVTVTDAECVTDEVVTDAESGRHALQMRDTADVTHSASGRHALNAPRTVIEPSEEEPSVEPSPGSDPIPGQTCLIEAAAEAAADKPRRTAAKKKPSTPKPLNRHAIADELTAAFWEHHGKGRAQPFIATRGVIRAAISNGVERDTLARVLDQLAREGRSISGGTIQTALAKTRGPQQQDRPVAGGLTQSQWDEAYARAQARDAAEAARQEAS
ncbi:helix-turn-helix domain-containing protein [Yinghuangia aomiensis]